MVIYGIRNVNEKTIPLSDYLKESSEERTTEILSSFSCPENQDIETFLKNNAISFTKQGIA
jgi:hypothetical protein